MKTALITGASRGIGKAIATLFAENGYELFLVCHNSGNELTELADMLSLRFHIPCHTFLGDVGNCEDVSHIFDEIKHLDVLINNAGIAHIGLLSDMTWDEWKAVISTNLDSCFYTCKHAIPLMLQNHSGRIINISSVWGNVGASMEVAYSASKGGVNAFTKALAKELAPSNIQVNAVACGIINTDMNAHLDADELESLREEIPADRLGTPEEVAALVLQLAQSPAYLTGQIITMDGGWC